MDESILNSIKKLLGLGADYDAFDQDLLIHINSVFMNLNQLGVGPKDPVVINTDVEVWDLFGEDTLKIQAIKTFTYLKVRLVFDPPAQSFVLNALQSQISEYEWRLKIQAEEAKEATNDV